jgi:Skp family chaperone for outer membrane proteins
MMLRLALKCLSILVLYSGLCAQALVFSASAQQPQGEPDTKAVSASPASGRRALPYAQVAVIDVPGIFRQSLAMQSIQLQLASRKETLQKDMLGIQEAVRQAEQELARVRQTAASEEFDRKRSEFENKVSSTARAMEERTRREDVAFNQARQRVIAALDGVVAEVAKEAGATLVVSREIILYQQKDGSIDLTQEVLLRLNARLPSVRVAADAEPQ